MGDLSHETKCANAGTAQLPSRLCKLKDSNCFFSLLLVSFNLKIATKFRRFSLLRSFGGPGTEREKNIAIFRDVIDKFFS